MAVSPVADMTGGELVSQTLEEYGAMTRAALNEYLPTREPRRFLYDLVAEYPNRGGKMMRPSLCIAASRLFGSNPESAVQTAAAIELLHNALLIHDDIEDESEQRRGRPTLHRMHGVPLALNAGDMLALMTYRPLLENRRVIGDTLALKVLDETERMTRECAEGQAMELGWRRYNVTDIGEGDYLEMVLKKTCWLATIYPLRVGALIGSHGGADLDGFLRFGFFLGAAFQIQDDILNLFADERYGKELNGDLWEGKRTLMVIHALQQCDADERIRFSAMLGKNRDERTAQEVAWVRELIEKYHSIEHAQEMASALAGAALHEFSLISAGLPHSRDREFLAQMPRWVIERN